MKNLAARRTAATNHATLDSRARDGSVGSGTYFRAVRPPPEPTSPAHGAVRGSSADTRPLLPLAEARRWRVNSRAAALGMLQDAAWGPACINDDV